MKKRNLRIALNEIFIKSSHKSMERALIESLDDQRIKGYLRKGIPAYRILKLLNNGDFASAEMVELISSIPYMNREQRLKLGRILSYLNQVDNAMESFKRFLEAMKIRIFIMNILLAITYSIFPWLASFIELLGQGLALKTTIKPNLFEIILYFLPLLILSISIMHLIMSRKSIMIQIAITAIIYFLMQLLISAFVSSNWRVFIPF